MAASLAKAGHSPSNARRVVLPILCRKNHWRPFYAVTLEPIKGLSRLAILLLTHDVAHTLLRATSTGRIVADPTAEPPEPPSATTPDPFPVSWLDRSRPFRTSPLRLA